MTIDDLGKYGMEQMDEEDIEEFLATQSLGILGLPTEDSPYLLPMSYGYEGGSRLYFFYVVGTESRKDALSDRAETASFLVYSAETLFNWESVLLTGTIEQLPEGQRSDLTEEQIPDWRPELFETASKSEATQFYEFRAKEWTGISYTGLPPGFRE